MQGGLIDLDVHPVISGSTEVLFPYMSAGWRRRFEPRATWPLPGTYDRHRMPRFSGKDNARITAMPPGGGAAGGDPTFVAHDLLDKYGIDAALLMSLQGSNVSAILDRKEAAVFASAYNDYLIEHWLEADSRFRLAMVVAPQDPLAAVAEIERTAGKPGVAALFLPQTDMAMSSAPIEPILAAAQDADLPVVTHANATFGLMGSPAFGGGLPTSFAAMYCLLSHHAQGDLTGLIWEGTFEKFPGLKIVFVEYGWTWVPSLMWRMDATWKSARQSMPWMKRPPSEYIFEHVRFTSQPGIEIPNARWESDYLTQMSADRVLCFSTDYPHWDSDDPQTVMKHVTPEVRQRIFRDNALETFGERMLPRQQLATT